MDNSATCGFTEVYGGSADRALGRRAGHDACRSVGSWSADLTVRDGDGPTLRRARVGWQADTPGVPSEARRGPGAWRTDGAPPARGVCGGTAPRPKAALEPVQIFCGATTKSHSVREMSGWRADDRRYVSRLVLEACPHLGMRRACTPRGGV